jgi:hypothetical protein
MILPVLRKNQAHRTFSYAKISDLGILRRQFLLQPHNGGPLFFHSRISVVLANDIQSSTRRVGYRSDAKRTAAAVSGCPPTVLCIMGFVTVTLLDPTLLDPRKKLPKEVTSIGLHRWVCHVPRKTEIWH